MRASWVSCSKVWTCAVLGVARAGIARRTAALHSSAHEAQDIRNKTMDKMRTLM
jgi:hypothetical protein